MARQPLGVAQSPCYGGNGGSPWDDYNPSHSPAITGVDSIVIYHGNQIDGLQVTYRLANGGTFAAPHHGGTTGDRSSIQLASNDSIVGVEGATNNVLVDQLTFITRNEDGDENRHGPYGKTGDTPFAVEGKEIVGFFGRSGDLLDGLGVYYIPTNNGTPTEVAAEREALENVNIARMRRLLMRRLLKRVFIACFLLSLIIVLAAPVLLYLV